MPIYEYSCKKCGNFETMQRITEDPLKKCPTCGAKVTKLISHSAFHLKGSGWYMTDYGKNGAAGSNSGKTDEVKPASSEAKESKPSSDTSATPATKETSATA